MAATAKRKVKRGNRLKALREASKLTQAEVAKLLDLDVSTVSRHESGDRGLTNEDIAAYAKLFKVESIEIFLEPREFSVPSKT